MANFRNNPENPHQATERKRDSERVNKESLSGSKQAKNRQHSRQNHGEGS